MFASSINSEIISDYDDFVKQLNNTLKKYDCQNDNFEQFAETWSNHMIQQTMKSVQERRLDVVEIGTGPGSELVKFLHNILFGKATEIAITVIWGNSERGKQAGKVMRKYLGKHHNH